MKGGEIVEITNASSSVNSMKIDSEGIKKDANSKDKKDFKDVLKETKKEVKPEAADKAPTSEIKTTDGIKAKDSFKTEKGLKVDASSDDSGISSDNKKNINELDLSQLIKMLMTLYGSPEENDKLQKAAENNDLEGVKEIIGGLINKAINPNELKISAYIISKDRILKELNNTASLLIKNDKPSKFEDFTRLMNVLSNDLVSDDAVKNEILGMLKNLQSPGMSDNAPELKELIIDKLTKLAEGKSQNPISENKSTITVRPEVKKSSILETDISSEDNLHISIDKNPTDKADDNAKSSSSNFETEEITKKPELKEEKLLNEVLSGKKNSSNDTFNEKLTNVMTRFENIKFDKASLPQEQPVIAKNNFNMDFVKTIKFMDVNNVQELSVKIIPRDLGEIVIRLTMDNGVMKANITAQNKETYNLLNSQLPAISNQLSEQNMTIQSFSLSLGNGENFMSQGNENGGNENSGRNRKTIKSLSFEEEDNIESYSLEENKINMLA